jgi:hypothetical protein
MIRENCLCFAMNPHCQKDKKEDDSLSLPAAVLPLHPSASIPHAVVTVGTAQHRKARQG